MTLQTTIESSGPHESELERRLGSVMWQRVKPSYDKLERQDAELAQLKAAPVERMAHAREVTIAEKKAIKEAREALVQQAIDDIGPQLQIEPRHNRVNKVTQRLINKRGLLYQYDELPPRKVIKRMLKAQGL